MTAADLSQMFHVGIRTADIHAAMAEIGPSLSVTWAELQVRDVPIWTPRDGAVTLPLSYTYSCEGPVHLELLQGPAGSIWDGNDAPGAHHFGVWSEDVATDTERLIAMGWTLEAAGAPPEKGYGRFTYVRSPTGFLYEPVSVAAKPGFEPWWAGGSL